jgi:RHS repeat-associated protein
MVNDFEVIHMGGRTYNPVLGRFMQADPFIQAPGNLQSFNRYSYVLNNPMSYTDPSGYFFKKLGKLIKDNWRTLASIAVGYVTFGLGTGIWSLAEMGSLTFGSAVGWGAAAGAASGFVSTGSLRGALSGAISGAAFGAIGRAGLGGVESFAVSGLTGGILSDVQGGKFGHGFVSAGIGVMAGGRFGQNPYAQVIGAAVVGGTISAVTGGKFANGAVGAAFAAALRADWDDSQNSSIGGIQWESEGTTESRKALVAKVKKDTGIDFEYEDEYAGSVRGKIVFTTSDVKEFRDWLAADQSHRAVNGIYTWGIFKDDITLYRTSVMGFQGAIQLTNGQLTGSFSGIERLYLTLGHEYAHSLGIENGSRYSGQAHTRSNNHGYELCLGAGYCSSQIVMR